MTPPRPAGGIYDLRERALPVAHLQKTWEPSDGPLPALFISHGAPPALDDHQWMDDLYAWAQSMPKPRAVVIISAHWEDAPWPSTPRPPAPRSPMTSTASTRSTTR
ncbi:hypothetical protein [uncultured Corynebacterium sp.]|uniref:hypothetical protein n=1 Tax=uncultured Corynebacterium sp. TaxID=159447 RepID=UPI0025EF1038|nr:hypothetical protein [uncultured Corynebacterium sp.]